MRHLAKCNLCILEIFEPRKQFVIISWLFFSYAYYVYLYVYIYAPSLQWAKRHYLVSALQQLYSFSAGAQQSLSSTAEFSSESALLPLGCVLFFTTKSYFCPV